jgi:eukaryotic-like serine/threonine-protein kinase
MNSSAGVAGAVTCRQYGNAIALLDAYARFQSNIKEHARMCASLLPNDLGLFDMLGNLYELCQDDTDEFRRGKKGSFYDHTNTLLSIRENNPRLLRGGPFNALPAFVRSAYRNRNAPSDRFFS